jgi:integrase
MRQVTTACSSVSSPSRAPRGEVAARLRLPCACRGVLRLTNFRRRCFDVAAQTVGLAGLTPHELRHTAASLAIGAGANVKAVQRMLGHKSAAMTLDVYADLFDDDLAAVADRLDAATPIRGVPEVRPQATVTPITRRNTAL